MRKALGQWPLLIIMTVLAWPVRLQYGWWWTGVDIAIYCALAAATNLGPQGWQKRHRVSSWLHNTALASLVLFCLSTVAERKANDHWQHPWIALLGVIVVGAVFCGFQHLNGRQRQMMDRARQAALAKKAARS